MSFTKELIKGKPVVFTGEDRPIPEVMLPEGKEKEALALLDQMGLIKITPVTVKEAPDG